MDYRENLQALLNKAPQPIETKEEYKAALWDRLMLEEADDFDQYRHLPCYTELVDYIALYEKD